MFLTCMRWLWLRRVRLSFFVFLSVCLMGMGVYDGHLSGHEMFS